LAFDSNPDQFPYGSMALICPAAEFPPGVKKIRKGKAKGFASRIRILNNQR
jgi:hypothetical protein